jgi:cytochrome c oxidase subunit 5b
MTRDQLARTSTPTTKGKLTWVFCCTEIKTVDDLRGPGAAPGTVPTDLEQSTGLERLEILGKMEGVDIFDMRPLDASRLGMRHS